MRTILEAKNVCKVYDGHQQHPILKHVNMSILLGEFVSVMGPSGSGKSTLLYNISGMDKMTSGSVRLDEREISSLTEESLSRMRLHKMGFVFQHNHLLKNLSIFDNIILSGYLAKKESRRNINERAHELMKKTGIVGLENHDITQASGGQLQRVAICRALINQPEILFADEPTGALNSKAANEIMDLLTTINHSGMTILIVTHDVKIAARTERVLYMIDGRIAGEKQLGKFDVRHDDQKGREEKLSSWLSCLGF